MKYTTFIFDLDGTLIHTMPEYRYNIVGGTLEELGVKINKHHIDRFWFEGDRDKVITECFNIDPDKFWETFKKHEKTEIREKFTKPYDDIDFISELRSKGIKVGIVTGAPVDIANLEIGIIGKEKFDAIVISHKLNGYIPKPHPHGLLECMKLLNSKNSETVYIGNAEEDVETARNAEVFDIYIDRKEHSFPDLKPSLKIDSLYELRKLITE